MFSVPPGPRLALGDHQHRLHGEDHPRLEDRVHVLPKLQTRLPAVVVGDDTEAVTVTFTVIVNVTIMLAVTVTISSTAPVTVAAASEMCRIHEKDPKQMNIVLIVPTTYGYCTI